MAEAARNGLRDPEDLSVACSGFWGHGDVGPIPLTSTEYNPAEIAAKAVGALLDPPARSHLVEPILVVRHSTAAVAVHQTEVAAQAARRTSA